MNTNASSGVECIKLIYFIAFYSFASSFKKSDIIL